LTGSLLIYGLAGLLMPVFAAIVLAYLLEGLIAKLEHRQVPRLVELVAPMSGKEKAVMSFPYPTSYLVCTEVFDCRRTGGLETDKWLFYQE